MKDLKEQFKKLLENNKHKDWNDLTFRETMADAFRFCANKFIEETQIDKQKVKEAINKFIEKEIKGCDDCEGYNLSPENTLMFKLKKEVGLK